MLVSYIYLSNENLADTGIINNINTVLHLFCSKDGLDLLCGNVEEIPSMLKKSSKKSRLIVLSPGIMSRYKENLNELSKKLSIETFLADDDGITSFVATYKNSYIAVLNDNCKEIISFLLSKLKYKDNSNLTYDYVNVNGVSIESVKETLKEQCPFSNPQLIAEEYYNYVRIHILALHDRFEYCDELCSDTKRNLKMLFGDNCFTDDIYKTVVDLLIEKNLKVATAESCTAGMISSAITSISNSSKVFEIGIASYSDRIKRDALGVSQSTIGLYGAVSMQTACEMARGIKNLSDADIGIAVTGVAGPNTSENKPVGTVYIAMTDGKKNWVIKPVIPEKLSRNATRERITYEVFDLLRRYLEYLPETLPDGTPVDAPCFLLYNQPHYNDGLIYNNIISEQFDNNVYDYDINDVDSIKDEQKIPEVISQGFTVNIPKRIIISRYFAKTFYRISDLISSASGFAKYSTAIIFALVSAIIISGSVFAYTYFSAEKNNNEIINQIRSSWNYSPTITTESTLVCFKPLNKINSEIDGWLKIDNTEINLPVCKADDNKFYSNHNYYKEQSRFGALYFDSNTIIERDKQNQNIVVYGNNTLNGSMFGSLKEYKSIKYMKQNFKINLCTEYASKDYLIFAVMIVTDDPKQNGENFIYNKIDFIDNNDFNDWIAQVKTRSLYKTDATISETSQILTLVTDSSEFVGAKLVIMAYNDTSDEFTKLVKENNYFSSININRSPRYPQKWYDRHGIVNPYEYKDTSNNTSSIESNTSSSIIVIRPNDTTSSDITSSDDISTDYTENPDTSIPSSPSSETTSSDNVSSEESEPSELDDNSSSNVSSENSSSEETNSSESDGSSDNSNDSSSNIPLE